MDHHCQVTGRCVGHHTYKPFVLWLISCCAALVFALVCLFARVTYGPSFDDAAQWLVWIAALVDCITLLPGASFMLIRSVTNLARNMTQIEVWERHWAQTDAASNNRSYTFPYDLGSTTNNFADLFGSNVLLW